MFLLSNYKNDYGVGWKGVSSFLQTRSSTQVRTHIQKFRVKVSARAKVVDKMIDEVKTAIENTKGSQGNSVSGGSQGCCLTKPQVRFIEELCKDYLTIYKTAITCGVKHTEKGKPVSFEHYIKMNKSVPQFIANIAHDPNNQQIMDANLAEILKNPHKTLSLLKELRTSIEQETECSTMKPERVKNKRTAEPSGRRTLKRAKRNLVEPVKPKVPVEEIKEPQPTPPPARLSQRILAKEPKVSKTVKIPKREKAKKKR